MIEFEECGLENKLFDKPDMSYVNQKPLDGSEDRCACQILYSGKFIDLMKCPDEPSKRCHVTSFGSPSQSELDIIEEFIKYTGLKKIKQ